METWALEQEEIQKISQSSDLKLRELEFWSRKKVRELFKLRSQEALYENRNITDFWAYTLKEMDRRGILPFKELPLATACTVSRETVGGDPNTAIHLSFQIKVF